MKRKNKTTEDYDLIGNGNRTRDHVCSQRNCPKYEPTTTNNMGTLVMNFPLFKEKILIEPTITTFCETK